MLVANRRRKLSARAHASAVRPCPASACTQIASRSSTSCARAKRRKWTSHAPIASRHCRRANALCAVSISSRSARSDRSGASVAASRYSLARTLGAGSVTAGELAPASVDATRGASEINASWVASGPTADAASTWITTTWFKTTVRGGLRRHSAPTMSAPTSTPVENQRGPRAKRRPMSALVALDERRSISRNAPSPMRSTCSALGAGRRASSSSNARTSGGRSSSSGSLTAHLSAVTTGAPPR